MTIKNIFKAILDWFKKIFHIKKTNNNSTPVEEIEYPVAPRFIKLPNNEMPIIATYAFYPPHIKEDNYKNVKECGFNVVGQSLSEANIDKALNIISKLDLFMVVSHPDKTNVDKIPSMVKKYKDNPNVWGFGVADEPSADAFEQMARLMKTYVEHAPNQNATINLLPAVGAKQLGTTDFRKYVSDFVQMVNPPFISYDCYPINQKSNGEIYVGDIIYDTLEVILDVAKKSNRPIASYILSNKHWSYPKPRTEFLRYQIFLALAYGAQVIKYWTYSLPDYDTKNEYTDALMDRDENKTDVWYMAQEVNTEVQKLRKVFLGCSVQSISHTGKNIPPCSKALDTLPDCIKTLKGTNTGMVVSNITNDGNEYVVLINKSVTEDQKVEIKTTKNITRVYPEREIEVSIDYNFILEKGGYAIFRI